MELTSKQRAQLRGMASTLDTIVHVGKDGIGENLIKQVNDALEARELIKGRVLENSMLTAREAAEELKVAARCEVVQVIGSKFVSAITNRDYTPIMGTTIFLATLMVFATLICDLLYKVVDPRIKYE